MNIRGEYWIIDGQVDFADGDIGDQNHESIAINHVHSQFASQVENLAEEIGINANTERHGEIDTEEINKIIDEIYEHFFEQGKMSSKQILYFMMQKIGCNEEALNILRGGGDARLYVMVHDSWIAVRSNNIEFYGYDTTKQKEIANAIGNILWEEGEEHFNPQEVDLSLYDHRNNKSWNTTLEELENPIITPKLQQLPTTTYNRPLPNPKDEEENKYSNPAKSNLGKMTNWRGASECYKFSNWLKNVDLSSPN